MARTGERGQAAGRRKVVAARKVRTGGRSARVVEDVLRHTVEVLGRVGYGALRVEDVAARSGVNKTTIYRRWPNKIQLVAAAVERLHHDATVEDTGDLQRDLFRSYRRMLEVADTAAVRGLTRMFQAERGDAELDAMVKAKREAHAKPRRARLKAAVARGELPRGTDIELLGQVLTDAIYARYARYGEIVSPEYLEKVIRLVLAGARADGAKGSKRARA